jgi:hypothetical protein
MQPRAPLKLLLVRTLYVHQLANSVRLPWPATLHNNIGLIRLFTHSTRTEQHCVLESSQGNMVLAF